MQNAVSDQDLDGLLTPVAMLFEILGEAQALNQTASNGSRPSSELSGEENLSPEWRPGFLDALKAAGQCAQSQGVKSLSHLASLLSPYLRQSRVSEDLEIAQTFTATLFSFLAGDLEADEAQGLYAQIKSWVQPLTPLPPSVDRIMLDRLADDSELLKIAYSERNAAQFDEDEDPQSASTAIENVELDHDLVGGEALAEDLDQGLEPRNDPEIINDFEISNDLEIGNDLELNGDLDFAQGQVDIEAKSDVPASAISASTVALDELEMVSEAWKDLCESLTMELAQQDWDDSSASTDELKRVSISECREKLENLSNALRFMTLESSAECLGFFSKIIEKAERSPNLFNGAHQTGLMRWAMAWSDAFLYRTPAAFSDAMAEMANDVWRYDQDVRSLFDKGLLELSSLNVIQSRQVGLRAVELEDEDFSLAIPVDADHNVVDQLLLELPQLSNEFSAHIEAIVAGSFEDLGDARRIAHTLKGSANTVGIRGIAHLTHSLEDLLQLLDDEGSLPDADLAETLSMAADCLAETSEAVAGQGDAPSGLADMYSLISTEINRRVSAKHGHVDEPQAAAPVLEPLPMANVTPSELVSDEARPSAELTSRTDGMSAERKVAELGSVTAREDEVLRVGAPLIEKLIEFNTDTALLMSQASDRILNLDVLRQSMRWGGERLAELSDELERMVDLRGLSITGSKTQGDFDALEMDEYNELHTLSRRIAEASADVRLMQQQLEQGVGSLKENLVQIERVQVEVRETTLQTRMVPASMIVPRLQRAARQASRMANKPITLQVTGERTSIEAQLLQQIVDSLGHLVRNAIDHGIEPKEQRAKAGKDESGVVTLSFMRVGATVEIVCSDDGTGLDLDRIRQRAITMGLVTEAQARASSEQELAQWIMLPGFSTKTEATQLSGRGIGMDVVQQTVRRMRGYFSIETHAGRGTSFKISLPLRVATLPVLVTRGAGQSFAISVRGLQQLLGTDGLVSDASGEQTYTFQDQIYPAFRLEQLIGLSQYGLRPASRETTSEVVVLVKLGDSEMAAVVVPELSQTRNVVVRTLPSYLPMIDGVEGAAVLGDGAIAPVVDLVELIARVKHGNRSDLRPMLEVAPQLLCMIVDDSVSVRRATELFVSDIGMDFVSAADGLEAVDILQKRVPDLFLLDLEMPRMNGVELARAIRSDLRTEKVPIIMISSRNSQKHRDLASSAGVDIFLTKPFTEDVLSRHIETLLTRKNA
jgi:chemotaxis protein histidine kinase CheA/CheY-like chemotaxis protein